MTDPNVNTLWGRAIVDELVEAGVDAAVLAPGSRSTPLTVAVAEHPVIETYSQLDERSAAFFALGRAKRTGKLTPLVCTSGTALANFHPAVVEADSGRVPMLLLTADRPPELDDSGANQTIDQRDFYGDAVRHRRTLPEPEVADRKLRSLRTAVCRSVAAATGTDPGPVHLNCPFRKPLEPTVGTGDVPDGWVEEHPLAAAGRDGPFVRVEQGRSVPDEETLADLSAAVEGAERGLVVCGPSDGTVPTSEALTELVEATGFPVLADPLSGHRFGPVETCGGYDSWVGAVEFDPDFALRFGASPTSKPLRKALAAADARQVVVDPAGRWREAEFTATDLAVASPSLLARSLAGRVDRDVTGWRERLSAYESVYWETVEEPDRLWEGGILADVAARAPDPSTVFVSNSMPVRDLDRFGRPREADLTVLGNRGASGIDGVTSTALGAGSATDDPLVLVTGDLAYFHDMNGLLAVGRCGVDATVVLVNNDGGGIFHLLPIEQHDTFEEYFRTPHGVDFEPSADLYGLEFESVASRDGFRDALDASLATDGTQVVEVRTDSEESHRFREALQARVESRLG